MARKVEAFATSFKPATVLSQIASFPTPRSSQQLLSRSVWLLSRSELFHQNRLSRHVVIGIVCPSYLVRLGGV